MPALPKRILYIQHAGALGGSCSSLLYQMQTLDKKRYHPILVLISDSAPVKEFYRSFGFEPIIWPGITFWNHTTALQRPLYKISTWIFLYKLIKSWKIGKQRTLALV